MCPLPLMLAFLRNITPPETYSRLTAFAMHILIILSFWLFGFSVFDVDSIVAHAAPLTPITSAPAHLLTLSAAMKYAIENSPALHATEQNLEASTHASSAQWNSSYLPRLSLNGNLRHVSEVPEIQIGPSKMPFGDHKGYSVGPALTYTIWDSGSRGNLQDSLIELVKAKRELKEATALQVQLVTETAYIQTQLTQEVLELTRKAAELSRGQNHDIARRLHSGAVSQLDAMAAQMDVSLYELKVAQSEGDFATSVAELQALVGPLDETSELRLENLTDSAERSAQMKPPPLSHEHPQILAQTHLAKSLTAAAQAQSSGYWPTLQAQVKSTIDYPNGPILEEIHQNTAMVNMSWSLWDWGSTKNLTAEKRAEAQAAEFQKEQMDIEWDRDYQKASALLESLRTQRKKANDLAQQAERLAKLNYSTYKVGKLTFLQVQTANLKWLEARIRKTQVDAQFLSMSHHLKFLAGIKETP